MNTPDTPLIDISGLRAERRDAERCFRLTVPRLRLHAGQRVAVLGPSGSGKSTLIDTVACARAPDAAQEFQVYVPRAGRSLDVAGAWRRGSEDTLTLLRAQVFGYVHQTGALLEFLSVHDNICISQHLAGRHSLGRVERLGEILGISDLFRSLPARLSGGQRQRVAIARALAHAPPIVVADEPTASLDRAIARVVMGLLCEAVEETRAALIVATHDVALVQEFGFAVLNVVPDDESGGAMAMMASP